MYSCDAKAEFSPPAIVIYILSFFFIIIYFILYILNTMPIYCGNAASGQIKWTLLFSVMVFKRTQSFHCHNIKRSKRQSARFHVHNVQGTKKG